MKYLIVLLIMFSALVSSERVNDGDIIWVHQGISKDKKVYFPMLLTQFKKPIHKTIATMSANNLEVYTIEFETKKKKKMFLSSSLVDYFNI